MGDSSPLSSTFIARTFDLPAGFFESDFARGASAMEILERDGVKLGEGTSARFDRSAEALEVKAGEGELWLVEAVVDYWRLIEEFEFWERKKRITELEEGLRKIVIPKVDFNETPLHEALAFLEEGGGLAKISNRNGTLGVKIVLESRPQLENGSGFGFDIPEGTVPITLKLAEVPFFEALRYIVSLAQRKYYIGETEIRVGYFDHFEEPRLTRAYPAPPELSRMILEQTKPLVADPFRQNDQPFEPTLKSLLENYGITFSYNTDLVFDRSRDLVIIRNTEDQHELLDVLIQSLVAKSESETWREVRELRFKRKIDTIVLPTLAFEQSPLIRVIESIELHSRLADREGSAWERGMPIWFNFWKANSLDYISPDLKISVDVSNLTIRQALARIAGEIGALVTVGPDGVKVSPIK